MVKTYIHLYLKYSQKIILPGNTPALHAATLWWKQSFGSTKVNGILYLCRSDANWQPPYPPPMMTMCFSFWRAGGHDLPKTRSYWNLKKIGQNSGKPINLHHTSMRKVRYNWVRFHNRINMMIVSFFGIMQPLWN